MAETSPIGEFNEQQLVERYQTAPLVELSDKDAVRHIVRLRLLTGPGEPYWEVSYCWGIDAKGEPVRVNLPVTLLPRQGRGAWSMALIKCFKDEGRWAKAMKLFEPGVISKVW